MPYPIHRYEAVVKLTPGEMEALQSWGEAAQRHRRQDVLQHEGDVVSGFYLLHEGWAMSSITLASGKRSIQKLHLPGDMLGTPNMILATAAYRLTAVTDLVTSFVPYGRVGDLFRTHPRLAALFMVGAQIERLMLMDALAMVGQTSPKQRAARLLLDLHSRLNPLGDVVDDTFRLPITQGIMSDVLGMTNVHLNRMLRELEDAGLIQRDKGMMRLNDLDALRTIAALPLRQPVFEPAWLPDP